MESRRAFVPGGTFFFTVVTYDRRKTFSQPAAARLLGSVLRRCIARWPMTVHAIVLLPDHWHTIWSLPSGDDAYPTRLGWAKKEFPSIGYRSVVPKLQFHPEKGVNAAGVFGSRGTGSTRSKTRMIFRTISIMSIGIRSSTGTCGVRRIGRIPVSIVGSGEGCIQRTGDVTPKAKAPRPRPSPPSKTRANRKRIWHPSVMLCMTTAIRSTV